MPALYKNRSAHQETETETPDWSALAEVTVPASEVREADWMHDVEWRDRWRANAGRWYQVVTIQPGRYQGLICIELQGGNWMRLRPDCPVVVRRVAAEEQQG